jgi:hypothetical protein
MLGLRQVQARAYAEAPDYPSPFSVSIANNGTLAQQFAQTNEENIAYTEEDGGKIQNLANDAVWPAHSFIMFSTDDNQVKTVYPMATPIPANTEFAGGNLTDNILPEKLNYNTATYKVQTMISRDQALSVFPPINFRNELHSEFPDAYLLVSKNPTFPSASTKIYDFDDEFGVAMGIAIEDGDYVTIAVDEEEAPGGVIGDFRMWLRADKLVEIDQAQTDPNKKSLYPKFRGALTSSMTSNQQTALIGARANDGRINDVLRW